MQTLRALSALLFEENMGEILRSDFVQDLAVR